MFDIKRFEKDTAHLDPVKDKDEVIKIQQKAISALLDERDNLLEQLERKA